MMRCQILRRQVFTKALLKTKNQVHQNQELLNLNLKDLKELESQISSMLMSWLQKLGKIKEPER